MELTTVWFILIAVLWIGYFVLEGFDFGVGMLLPVVGKDEAERRAVVTTLGPVWDGNEVWVLVAGGATFLPDVCSARCEALVREIDERRKPGPDRIEKVLLGLAAYVRVMTGSDLFGDPVLVQRIKRRCEVISCEADLLGCHQTVSASASDQCRSYRCRLAACQMMSPGRTRNEQASCSSTHRCHA